MGGRGGEGVIPDLISFGDDSNELSCGQNSSVMSQASGLSGQSGMLSQVSQFTDDEGGQAAAGLVGLTPGRRQQQQQQRGALPDMFSNLSVSEGGGLQPALGAGALMSTQQQQQPAQYYQQAQYSQVQQQQQQPYYNQQQQAQYHQQQQQYHQQRQQYHQQAQQQYQQQAQPPDPGPPPMSLGSHAAWEIDPSEITLGQRIGIGSYGEVYKGLWRGTEVAVKRFLEQNLSPQLVQVSGPGWCWLVAVSVQQEGGFVVVLGVWHAQVAQVLV